MTTQKKDVIYIDVEDDITAVIGKVKAAKEKIVAVVPPKRMGVLQSAVNLRLLSRTADKAGKRLVLITGNHALTGLAASARIPVAKTLQSRPEMAEVSDDAMDDEDVIEGSELPVGEHAGMGDDESGDESESDDDKVSEETIDDINIDGEPEKKKPTDKKSRLNKNAIKVPDFGMFRKKLVLFAAGGVLLIGFLVWAIWIAPHATVTVTARTSDIEVQTPVTLSENADVNSEKMTLPSITQTIKQSDSVDFTPTGKKDIGDKAGGTVVLYNCSTSGNPATVQAGTYLSSGGVSYILQSTVNIPAPTVGVSGICTASSFINPGQSPNVKIVAEEVGPDYNVSNGTTFEVAGRPDIVAEASSDISGGTSKTVTVVSTNDVKQALGKLTDDATEDVKADLMDMFKEDVVVIDDSFTINAGDQTVTPDLGEEVTGSKATLAIEISYSITGIPLDALDQFLQDTIKSQLGEDSGKQIFKSGARDVRMTDYTLSKDKKKATIQLAATGKIGPEIDENEIKEIVKGKRYGDVQSDLKAIDGISDVSMKLSPFWVFNAPDDVNKISIEFKILENKG